MLALVFVPGLLLSIFAPRLVQKGWCSMRMSFWSVCSHLFLIFTLIWCTVKVSFTPLIHIILFSFIRLKTAVTSLSLQIRYCITRQQRCGLTHTCPRATTVSPPLMHGTPSTTTPLAWPPPRRAPTLWGPTGSTGRRRLSCCRSNSSSSLVSSSRVNSSSCSCTSSSTTSSSSSCSISNNRWRRESGWSPESVD